MNNKTQTTTTIIEEYVPQRDLFGNNNLVLTKKTVVTKTIPEDLSALKILSEIFCMPKLDYPTDIGIPKLEDTDDDAR